MSEKKNVQAQEPVKSVVKLVNPFCVYKPIADDSKVEYKAYRVKCMEVDKETLTAEPVFEEFDLQAEINARLDDAGFNAMRTLIMTGQAKPEDFYDDGKHGFDNTVLPENIHEARKVADSGASDLAALAQVLGVKEGEELSPQVLETYLSNFIAKKWQEEQAKKAAEEAK